MRGSSACRLRVGIGENRGCAVAVTRTKALRPPTRTCRVDLPASSMSIHSCRALTGDVWRQTCHRQQQQQQQQRRRDADRLSTVSPVHTRRWPSASGVSLPASMSTATRFYLALDDCFISRSQNVRMRRKCNAVDRLARYVRQPTMISVARHSCTST